jgi:hypothetical protein
MPVRQHRFGVGADLVRNFPGAAQRAIAPDNDQINFSAREEQAGGVIGNDLM